MLKRADMLRISELAGNGARETCLRLDGQVIGQWVAELRRVCEEMLARSGGAVVLDLAGVSFLDGGAVVLFRDLAAAGVQFINGSAFIAEQLKGIVHVES